MNNHLSINKVAILGAGVMGAQIAAHFANSQIPVVLFDLKASNSSQGNSLIEKAIAGLAKLSPKPIVWNTSLDYITAANYEENLELLKDCDLIIEAIAERLDWKEALYHKIANYVKPNAIIASNTSGLSITSLAGSLPEQLRANFCGIHFFNPPRYMPLVELIPHDKISASIIPDLEGFLVSALGKSVIIARDTPNFIANRLGVFSMLATCIHTQQFNIPLEVVDKLTGKQLGRAKSATFRTADVVGLDIFAHVVETMHTSCNDSWSKYYTLPEWIDGLIKQGALGQKVKAGFYKKDASGIKVFDIANNDYRNSDQKPSAEIIEMLSNKSWAIKLESLRNSNLAEAQFLWACFRDSFHYAVILLGEISDSPRDMDLALRWGFGWKEGLFEIWQKAGWIQVANWIKEDIDSGKSLSSQSLPQWVFELKDGIYFDNKYYSVKQNNYITRQVNNVYNRQLFPNLVVNEIASTKTTILYENQSVKLWTTGDEIGVLSFKTKMCAIGKDVLTGISEALIVAQEQCQAMVIWQEQDVFSVGANLEEFGFDIMMNGAEAVDNIINMGHRVITQELRYSHIPVVAAVKGYTFGGGCEIMLHCDAIVAAMESYIGLIEAGVGLIPGWGGSTEMAFRASQSVAPWSDFEKRYKNLALAKVATSAREAMQMGYLRESDTIVMNVNEILLIAKEKAKLLALSNYRPPVKAKFKVFGNPGIATVKGLLANMSAGGQISKHDLLIATNLAITMCGGAIDKDSLVSHEWLLSLEKTNFKQLALTKETSDRIMHMLTTGKPLRN